MCAASPVGAPARPARRATRRVARRMRARGGPLAPRRARLPAVSVRETDAYRAER